MRRWETAVAVLLALCAAEPARAGDVEDCSKAEYEAEHSYDQNYVSNKIDQTWSRPVVNTALDYCTILAGACPLTSPRQQSGSANLLSRAMSQAKPCSAICTGKAKVCRRTYVQAYMWLNLVAKRIPATEILERNAAVYERDQVERKMTPAQIAEAQRLTSEWNPKTNRSP